MRAGYFIICAFLAVSLKAQDASRFYAVEVTDNVKQKTRKVAQQSEYDVLQAEARRNNQYLTTALRLARTAWLADPQTSKKGFPSNVSCPAKVKVLGVFADSGQAEAKLAEQVPVVEEGADTEKDGYIEKKLATLREQLGNIVYTSLSNNAREKLARNINTEITALEEALTKQNALKEEQKAIEIAARALILQKLANATGGGAAAKSE